MLLGTLLVQAAWIIALPPFRGTDEVDHAYRAAAVAAGQWRPGAQAVDGRGRYVIVPRDLVRAAYPACHGYNYASHDNCSPAREAGRDRVVVASAAATYHPVFYWLIGTAARPFHGAASLLVMRAMAALLCATFLAVGVASTVRWRRTSWPVVGLLVAMTPVMLFSVSLAAPNGLEMAASATLWLALHALLRDRPTSPGSRGRLLVVAAAAAATMCLLRSIGPLWVLLITLAVVLPHARRVVSLVRDRPLIWVGAAASVAVAAALSAAWTLTNGTNALEPLPTGVRDPVSATADQVPLWLLQTIAAFPRRGDPAPGVVYLLVGAVWLLLVASGLRWAARGLRLTMLITVAGTLVVPFVLTVSTIEVAGPIWQGRYGLPLAVGVALTAGVALDDLDHDHAPRTSTTRAAVGGLVAALAAANVVSLLHVHGVEVSEGPMAGSGEIVPIAGWGVAALVFGGFATWAVAALSTTRDLSTTLDR